MPVPVTLYSAIDEPRPDPSLGWEGILGRRLKVVAVPGNHHSMMQDPHRQGLGAAIDRALSALDR